MTVKNVSHNHEQMVENILSVYRQCLDEMSESELKESHDWYITAHKIARDYASQHNVSFKTTVGIMAAFSINSPWDRNLFNLEKYFEIRKENKVPDTGMGLQAMGYPIKLANRIWDSGDNFDSSIFGGNKVSDFFTNIYQPEIFNACTVDRWAFRIATRCEKPNAKSGSAKDALYARIKDAWIEAARRVNLWPNAIQAITWVYCLGDMQICDYTHLGETIVK